MEKIQKKSGIISDLISGVGGLVILVILVLVIVSTLLGANLLGAGTVENQTAYDMSANLTAGIQEVSSKIPTVLLIAAVVLLLGVLLLLYARARESGLMGAGGSTL